jgi:hypothetical protein
VPDLEQSFALQLRIGFGYGVVADHNLFRERTNAGQLIPALQNTRFYCMANLLHQLQVEGLARLRVELEQHNFTVLLLWYSLTDDYGKRNFGGVAGT